MTSRAEYQAAREGVGKFQAYAMVRGKDGRPKVDHLNEMPRAVWDGLSQEDQDHLIAIHGEYSQKS